MSEKKVKCKGHCRRGKKCKLIACKCMYEVVKDIKMLKTVERHMCV